MSNPQIRQFGLLLRSIPRYGSRYVEVVLCSRKPGAGDDEAPLGVADDSCDPQRPKHLDTLALDGLGLYGFVSGYRDGGAELCPFIGDKAEYRNLYVIDERRAALMAKTLKKINAAMSKAKAYEPGDRFAVLAGALRLDFVVEDRERDLPRNGQRWRYMTVAEGRNRYREIIEQACATETERLFPHAKVAS
jgi:hypothetical protein